MFSFCAIIFLPWRVDLDTRMLLVNRLLEWQRVTSLCIWLFFCLYCWLSLEGWIAGNHRDRQGVCDIDKKMISRYFLGFLSLMIIRWFLVCFCAGTLAGLRPSWLTKMFIFIENKLFYEFSISNGIYMYLHRLLNAARRWHECSYTAVTNAPCPNQT